MHTSVSASEPADISADIIADKLHFITTSKRMMTMHDYTVQRCCLASANGSIFYNRHRTTSPL